MKSFFRQKFFLSFAISIAFSLAQAVSVSYASTTISTDINTDGTLTVTGISNLKDKIYNSFGALMLDQAGQTNTNIVLNPTSGNVGVGTSSPAQILDVWGNLQIGTSSTPTLFVNTTNGYVGIGTSTVGYQTNAGVAMVYPAQFSVQGNAGLDVFNSYDSSGRVIQQLNQLGNFGLFRHTANSNGAGFNVRRDRNGAIVQQGDYIFLMQANPSDGTTYRTMATIDALIDNVTSINALPTAWRFTTGSGLSNSERMRITSTGLVGIGITAPTALLHISTTTPGMDVFKLTAGSNNLVYDKNGNIGIGTTTPSASLDVNGYVKALLQATSTACSASNKGSIFYNEANDSFWGCKSSGWVKLDN